MALGHRSDLPVPNSNIDGSGDWQMVCGTNCCRNLLEWSMVQRCSCLPAHVVRGDRARGSVNQTFIEPDLSYNFESGWYVDSNPSITFDWTAAAADGWTVPMGVDIGKAFNIGSQATSLQIGSYDLVKRPTGNPQWIIRVQLTLLFPK